MDTVGLVTPLYATERNRRLAYFGNTVKSVLAQRGDFLWLIVDDGSPDPAAEAYLRRLEELDSRIRVLRRERKADDRHTASNALNLGMAEILESGCSSVTYLHSDDWLLRDSLRLRHRCLEKGFDMAYAKCVVLAGRSTFEKSPEFDLSERNEGAHFGVFFPHHTTMWRRDMLSAMMEERHGELFDPGLCYGEDLDVTLFTRNFLARKAYNGQFVDEPVYVWNSDSEQNISSVNRQYEQLRQMEYAYSKNGFSYRGEVGLKKYLAAYAPNWLRGRIIKVLGRKKLPGTAQTPFSFDGFEDDLFWFKTELDPSIGNQVDSLA